jgi:hypothetical protein
MAGFWAKPHPEAMREVKSRNTMRYYPEVAGIVRPA